MKSKLVHEIRHGLLVLRICRAGSGDPTLHILSLHRLYRNGQLWHESTRFGRDDIPFMRYLLDEAHTWMLAEDFGVQQVKDSGECQPIARHRR